MTDLNDIEINGNDATLPERPNEIIEKTALESALYTSIDDILESERGNATFAFEEIADEDGNPQAVIMLVRCDDLIHPESSSGKWADIILTISDKLSKETSAYKHQTGKRRFPLEVVYDFSHDTGFNARSLAAQFKKSNPLNAIQVRSSTATINVILPVSNDIEEEDNIRRFVSGWVSNYAKKLNVNLTYPNDAILDQIKQKYTSASQEP